MWIENILCLILCWRYLFSEQVFWSRATFPSIILFFVFLYMKNGLIFTNQDQNQSYMYLHLYVAFLNLIITKVYVF